jgi:hypothetical protein
MSPAESADFFCADVPAAEFEREMTWYVTFEVQKRGLAAKRRSPRATKTFESETEAKSFARAKFNEGLIVYAGTINPHSPRQMIAPSDIACWLGDEQEGDSEDRDDA